MRWAGHVARMEDSRNAFKIVTGKSTGKRPLGKPSRRWGDYIRMDLEEIGINTGSISHVVRLMLEISIYLFKNECPLTKNFVKIKKN